MNKYILSGILGVMLASMAFMGFQCSSAEMTSAKLYIQRKEYQNAEAQLLKELAKNPKNEEAWYTLGRAVRYELNDYKGTKDAFTKALEISAVHKKDIDNILVGMWGKTFNQGVEQLNTAKDSSDFDKAIETYKLAIYLQPDSMANYQNLGLAYYKKGDFEGAIQPLTTAMDKGNSLFAVNVLSGIYLVRANEAKSKFQEVNRAVLDEAKNLDQVREKVKAKDVKYYIGEPATVDKETKGKGKSAVVVKEMWKYPKYNLEVTVEGELVTVVKFSTPYQPKIDSTEAKVAQAEYSKAIAVLRKGVTAFPQEASLNESLMNAYIGAERNNEARELLVERVKKYPNNEYDRYNYGVFLLKDNKFEEAVNEFKAVLEIKPDFSSAVYNLAATYVNWGVAEQERLKKAKKEDDKSYQEKFRSALPYLEKVVIDKPNDVQIWELLGQVYAQLNEGTKATEAFKKADDIRAGKN